MYIVYYIYILYMVQNSLMYIPKQYFMVKYHPKHPRKISWRNPHGRTQHVIGHNGAQLGTRDHLRPWLVITGNFYSDFYMIHMEFIGFYHHIIYNYGQS